MKPEFLSRRGGSAPVTRPLREAATAAAAAPEALLRGARAVSRSLTALTTDEHARLLLLAAFIGLAAALAVTAFYRVIDLVQRLTLGWAEAIPLADALVIPLLVALGLSDAGTEPGARMGGGLSETAAAGELAWQVFDPAGRLLHEGRRPVDADSRGVVAWPSTPQQVRGVVFHRVSLTSAAGARESRTGRTVIVP